MKNDKWDTEIDDMPPLSVLFDVLSAVIISLAVISFVRYGFSQISDMIKQQERPYAEYYSITVYDEDGDIDHVSIASQVSLTASYFIRAVDIDTGKLYYEPYTKRVKVTKVLSDHTVEIVDF